MALFLFALRFVTLASGIFLGASVFFGAQHQNYRALGTIISRVIPPFRPMAVVAATSILALLLFEPAIRSWLQYALWATTPQSRGLMPPYTPISYYFGYVFFHFWLWRVLGMLFAGLMWYSVYAFFVKRTNSLLMDRREAFLLAFGIALSGWPNFLVYLVTFLLLYVLFLMAFTTTQKLGGRGGEAVRFPVSPFLTLALIPAVLYGNMILKAIGLGSILRVSLYGV